MSALADFAHKFGSESRELKIGQSFFNDADSVFHTIRYDFVPASVDPNKTSAVDFGQNGKVTVTMPNLEGSGTTESVYQGQRKPHQKECVLIINNETGDMILEKLNTSMIVKKARLRQEDLTGKSLALNKSVSVNGGGSSLASSSTNSLSQVKSSINDKKASSVSSAGSLKSGPSIPNAAKLQKQSPPLTSANSNLAQPRSNGFQPKTPSPPSMPIFSANKSSLTRNMNGSSNAISTELSSDWNGLSKSKSQVTDSGKPNRKQTSVSKANRLSEESSSDSSDGGNSDESSSSQSSDSSSEDEEMVSEKPLAAANSRSNALSMPSLSMPTSLVALSGLSDSLSNVPQNSTANSVKSPPLATNDLKKSIPLSLSEDSDSSDDESHRKQKKLTNGKNFAKAVSNGKIEQVQKGPPVFVPENSKSFPDSMPKFNNDTSSATTFPSMPKYSQLSQDLQLSESGSDSDD